MYFLQSIWHFSVPLSRPSHSLEQIETFKAKIYWPISQSLTLLPSPYEGSWGFQHHGNIRGLSHSSNKGGPVKWRPTQFKLEINCVRYPIRMCEVQLQFVWFISQFLGAVINWDDKKNFKIVEIKVVVIFVVFSPHGAWYDREFEANPWAEFSRGSYVAFYGSYLSIFKKLRFYFWDGQKFHQHTPFSYQHPTIFLARRPTHLYFKTKITIRFYICWFLRDSLSRIKTANHTQKS